MYHRQYPIRQTNFEILRIFAMFLVLLFHANFLCIGTPTQCDIMSHIGTTVFRTFIESASVVCVNVFVLISGWFGINATFRGLMKFIFQCLYFLIGTYIVTCLLGINSISITGLKGCFFLLSSSNWFIRAYIGLYILSPILNIFLNKSSKADLKKFLILFYVFQTIFGCTNISQFIAWGYSTFSFIGLYCLAYYIRNYVYVIKSTIGGVIYLLSIFINTILFIIGIYWGYDCFIYVYSYVNPIVIMGAVGLIIFTSKIEATQNPYVNFIAKSSFAVYLLHASPSIFSTIYKPIICILYNDVTIIRSYLQIILFIVLVFILAIILDQSRKQIWTKINKK